MCTIDESWKVDIGKLDTMRFMDEPQSLGRYIRQSRLDRGMSLGQLATEIGRSSSSVRRWERDEVAPALTVMPVLADALKVDVGELEKRRPGLVDDSASVGSDDESTDAGSSSAGPSTLEQQAVQVTSPDPATDSPSSRLGLFGDMWSALFEGKDAWIGWVRGIATAVIIIVLLVIFVWAVGELFTALKQVWDSLGTG